MLYSLAYAPLFTFDLFFCLWILLDICKSDIIHELLVFAFDDPDLLMQLLILLLSSPYFLAYFFYLILLFIYCLLDLLHLSGQFKYRFLLLLDLLFLNIDLGFDLIELIGKFLFLVLQCHYRLHPFGPLPLQLAFHLLVVPCLQHMFLLLLLQVRLLHGYLIYVPLEPRDRVVDLAHLVIQLLELR